MNEMVCSVAGRWAKSPDARFLLKSPAGRKGLDFGTHRRKTVGMITPARSIVSVLVCLLRLGAAVALALLSTITKIANRIRFRPKTRAYFAGRSGGLSNVGALRQPLAPGRGVSRELEC